MLATFACLLVFQSLGEGIVFSLGLPVPGPVAGMLLLIVALAVSPALLTNIEKGGTELLRHLSMLFVPAGVGIVVSASSVSGHWLAIIAAMVGSTVLTLVVTAEVTRTVISLGRNDPRDKSRDAQYR